MPRAPGIWGAQGALACWVGQVPEYPGTREGLAAGGGVPETANPDVHWDRPVGGGPGAQVPAWSGTAGHFSQPSP